MSVLRKLFALVRKIRREEEVSLMGAWRWGLSIVVTYCFRLCAGE